MKRTRTRKMSRSRCHLSNLSFSSCRSFCPLLSSSYPSSSSSSHPCPPFDWPYYSPRASRRRSSSSSPPPPLPATCAPWGDPTPQPPAPLSPRDASASETHSATALIVRHHLEWTAVLARPRLPWASRTRPTENPPPLSPTPPRAPSPPRRSVQFTKSDASLLKTFSGQKNKIE